MRQGGGGYEAELNEGGRRGTEARHGRATSCWARSAACLMSCFSALSCCAPATPSPSRLRRVPTQTSVERLLPLERSDAPTTGVVLSPPALMRAPSLPLSPRSPEPHPMPRPRAEGAEYEEEEDDICAAKKRAAALELPEECPLCLEVRDCAGPPVRADARRRISSTQTTRRSGWRARTASTCRACWRWSSAAASARAATPSWCTPRSDKIEQARELFCKRKESSVHREVAGRRPSGARRQERCR